eukprot:TRINITY_DN2883_c0_g1_i3.p1 TRINITY_DN2883_c0_g1~~TRINITY_DN2883_c0_g1_i3.p1  ORF type:complete len:391 (+),score=124.49 TRINITY_DN2883_c0_g1_i3:101-1174(+)
MSCPEAPVTVAVSAGAPAKAVNLHGFEPGQAVEGCWDGEWLAASVKGPGATGVLITWEDGSMSDMPPDQVRPRGAAAAPAPSAAQPAPRAHVIAVPAAAARAPPPPPPTPGGLSPEERAETAKVCEEQLPEPVLPTSDKGMTDATKAALVGAAREGNKRVLEINETLLREVKRLRSVNTQIKQKSATDRLQQKMVLEQRVRLRVQALEVKQRAEAAYADPSSSGLNLDPGSLLNHLCHLRGWPYPADEYKSIPLPVQPRQPFGKGQKRACEYICVMKLVKKTEDGKEETELYEGDKSTQKKEAKQSAIKKLILAQFPECDSFEQVKQKVGVEHANRKKRRAQGGGGWGGGGWKKRGW